MPEIKYDPTTATQAVIKKTIEEYAPQAINNKGGYTYINGALMPSALSRVLARALRVGRIIRPGVGKTEEFMAAQNPDSILSVTVQLQNNIGVHARTLRGRNSAGTENNDGLLNMRRKLIPSTTPFEIPVRQLVDDPVFFPRLKLETMLFDEISATLENYCDNSVNAEDSYDIAKMIAYAMYRGAEGQSGTATDPSTYGDNIITFDMSTAYDDLSAIKLINQLNAVMSRGDKKTNLGTFTGKRQLTLKSELLGIIKSPKTGYVTNTDKGANLFYSPNFDDLDVSAAARVGQQYRGAINGYEMYEMNDQILDLAAEWLGLPEGSLSGILGVVSTTQSYAGAGVGKKSFSLLQSTEYDGVVGFPFIKFGGAAYRKIFLIVDKTWTVPTALQSKLAPARVVAPARWADASTEPIERVVYDTEGNPTSIAVMDVIAPNGDASCAVTIMVTNSANGTPVTNATVSPTYGASNTAVSNVRNNGNGSYTFLVPKGQSVGGTVAASGFTSGSITIAATATDKWVANASVKLTASE